MVGATGKLIHLQNVPRVQINHTTTHLSGNLKLGHDVASIHLNEDAFRFYGYKQDCPVEVRGGSPGSLQKLAMEGAPQRMALVLYEEKCIPSSNNGIVSTSVELPPDAPGFTQDNEMLKPTVSATEEDDDVDMG